MNYMNGGLLIFDGRGCGNWSSHVAKKAQELGLECVFHGHQMVTVQLKSWSQVPLLLDGNGECPCLYKSVRIEAEGE